MNPTPGIAAIAGAALLCGAAFAQSAEPEWDARWDDPDAPEEILQERYSEEELANRRIVIDFYEAALNEKDWERASQYVGEHYIQHNPRAPTGPEGIQAHVEMLAEQFPENHGEIKHVYVDGDIVVLHIHSKRTPDSPGNAVVDILRVEDGKVIEHWDVIQAVVPGDEALNDNTMW